MDDQQLLDLMSEAGILTLNSISNQFDVHVNKAKSILDKFSKSQKGLNIVYYVSGLKDEKISISLINAKDLKSKSKEFQKLFSIHIYAITNKDFDEEKLTVSPITSAHGIRDITFPKKKAIKLPRPSEDVTADAETNNGIFKKREPVKKGVAKAFSKIESKSSTKPAQKEIKKEASTKVTKSNSKVSSFFENTKAKTESKAAKKEVKATKKEPEPDNDDFDDDAMDVDHSPKKVKKGSSPSPHKRKTKNQNKETKPKRRRVQMDSSSDEDEQDEAQKLLFGDEEEDRLRNISIEEDKSEILAENTILTSDESEHEGVVDSEDEKENKPKKKKTSFGTAKVIGDGKATKKVKKTRYHVDDEGNMVSEQYFEEEEIDEAELKAMQEKDKIEKEKKIEKIKKLTPPKVKPAKSTTNKKQKSIASFFTKKK